MNDATITRLLEERAARVDVGPPPLDSMTRDATRKRRRRGRYAAALASAAVAAVAGGAVVVAGITGDTHDRKHHARPALTPPAGSHWIGAGHAAIAVPDDGLVGTAACRGGSQGVFRCVVLPDGDTVSLGSTLSSASTSQLTSGSLGGFRSARDATTCTSLNGAQVCRGELYIPDQNADFVVTSPHGEARVDEVLDSVRVLPDLVGVPAPRGTSSTTYAYDLRALGLHPDPPPGSSPVGAEVDSVSPAAGTMVPVGSTVYLSVSVTILD